MGRKERKQHLGVHSSWDWTRTRRVNTMGAALGAYYRDVTNASTIGIWAGKLFLKRNPSKCIGMSRRPTG